MWLKLIGAMCVCSATTGYGYWKSGEYKKHIDELEHLKKHIWMLQGELTYSNAALSEICYRLHKKAYKPYDAWFLQLAENQERRNYPCLGELWKHITEEYLDKLFLTKDEFMDLQNLGFQLGFQDVKMQVQILQWYIEQIDKKRMYIEERVDEKQRLSRTLGVMSGILICIMLV